MARDLPAPRPREKLDRGRLTLHVSRSTKSAAITTPHMPTTSSNVHDQEIPEVPNPNPKFSANQSPVSKHSVVSKPETRKRSQMKPKSISEATKPPMEEEMVLAKNLSAWRLGDLCTCYRSQPASSNTQSSSHANDHEP